MDKIHTSSAAKLLVVAILGFSAASVRGQNQPRDDRSHKVAAEQDIAKLSRAFLTAADEGDLATVNDALARGGNVDATDEEGSTALKLAVTRGHIEVVRVLLLRGADRQIKNIYGHSPVMSATWGRHTEIVRLLNTSGQDLARLASAQEQSSFASVRQQPAIPGRVETPIRTANRATAPKVSAPPVSPPPSRFVVALPSSMDRATQTKVVVRTTPDPGLWIFSAASGERIESLLTQNGPQLLLWADGAVHVHSGGRSSATPRDLKMNFSSARGGSDGQLIAAGTGEVVEETKLPGWQFDSDAGDPLVFRVTSGVGYVYQSGRGTVTSPSGKFSRVGPLRK